MPTLVSSEVKDLITNKLTNLLDKDLYTINWESLGKRSLGDTLVSDYRLTLSEILSSPFVTPPIINFFTIDSLGGTFNIPANQQAYVIVEELAPNFTFEFNGINGSTFDNYFDVNDFSNCYLDITNTSEVSSNKDRVYVTENVSFSTVNNEFFTFYYFNTGSLILGFSPASATLEEPLDIPALSSLPSLSSLDPGSFEPSGTPTPTPTPSEEPEPEVTPTPTPTPSEEPEPEVTPTPTPTPSEEPEPEVTPTPTPTPTETCDSLMVNISSWAGIPLDPTTLSFMEGVYIKETYLTPLSTTNIAWVQTVSGVKTTKAIVLDETIRLYNVVDENNTSMPSITSDAKKLVLDYMVWSSSNDVGVWGAQERIDNCPIGFFGLGSPNYKIVVSLSSN
jgi:hypothetical protein